VWLSLQCRLQESGQTCNATQDVLSAEFTLLGWQQGCRSRKSELKMSITRVCQTASYRHFFRVVALSFVPRWGQAANWERGFSGTSWNHAYFFIFWKESGTDSNITATVSKRLIYPAIVSVRTTYLHCAWHLEVSKFNFCSVYSTTGSVLLRKTSFCDFLSSRLYIILNLSQVLKPSSNETISQHNDYVYF
jgi:hypothetical protein